MRRFIPLAAAVTVLAGLIVATTAVGVGQPSPTTPAAKTPRWVTHVARYPGGISGGVRAIWPRPGEDRLVEASKASPIGRARRSPGNNVQMNDDSYPPLPQNETAVAYNVDAPEGRRRGGERLRQRRRRGDADVRRRAALGEHADHAAVPRHRRLLQRRRPGSRVQPPGPRVLPVAAVLLPRAAVLRGAGLQVGRQRPDLDAGPAGRASPRPTSTTPTARSTSRSSTTRSSSPSTTTRPARTTAGSTSPTPSSTFSRAGSATTARSSSPTPTRSRRRTRR